MSLPTEAPLRAPPRQVELGGGGRAGPRPSAGAAGRGGAGAPAALRRRPRPEPRARALLVGPAHGADLQRHPARAPADTTVEIEQDLYGASGPRLLARLRRLDDDVPSVLVIGHNPGVHSLASMLTGAGDPELRGRLATAFPTGSARHPRLRRLLGRPRARLRDAGGLRGPTRAALIPDARRTGRTAAAALSAGAAPSASGWSSRPGGRPRRAARSRRRWSTIRRGAAC